MGEIRSTLDIIMEKTKGLTMTEEEKAAYKQEELVGKVRGLIQKYLDKTLSDDRLKVEVAALGEDDQDRTKQVILEESISKIALGEDNDPVLEILESAIGLDTTRIKEALIDFEGRLEQERDACKKTMMKRLEERGISGSAVVPNIAADPEWTQNLAHLEEALRETLRSLNPAV